MSLDSVLPLVSIGTAFATSDRIDGAGYSTRVHHYEIFTQAFFSTPTEHFFLRPGVRFAYENIPQAEEAQWVGIDEQTLRSGLELGLVYNGYLVPSVTLQSALLARRIKLHTAQAVTEQSSRINTTEWLASGSLSFGLGIPIADGRVLIEPFYRIVRVASDERQKAHWGCDASWALSP